MRRVIPNRAVLLLLGAVSGCLPGCLPGYLRMDIRAPQGLNDSTPIHFLVREVDTQQYRTESYDAVAMLVAQRDPGVLRAKVLYAKNKAISERMWIKTPGKKAVAVYFLFTRPQGPWKILFEPPFPTQPPSSLIRTASSPRAKATLRHRKHQADNHHEQITQRLRF